MTIEKPLFDKALKQVSDFLLEGNPEATASQLEVASDAKLRKIIKDLKVLRADGYDEATQLEALKNNGVTGQVAQDFIRDLGE